VRLWYVYVTIPTVKKKSAKLIIYQSLFWRRSKTVDNKALLHKTLLTRISHSENVKCIVTLLFIIFYYPNLESSRKTPCFSATFSPQLRSPQASLGENLKWPVQRTQVRFRCHFIFALLRKKFHYVGKR